MPTSDTASAQRSSWLFDRRDVALLALIAGVGLALRLAWYSGFGLGDDVIFRHFINNLVSSRMIDPSNFSYRVTWWFPTALVARLIGVNEAAMIYPITAASIVGIGVVYALGKALWGRPGALVGALLLSFLPLDFAWSTMLTNDILGSVCSALSMLFAFRALEPAAEATHRRHWKLAALFLWLSYLAKASAALMGPPLLLLMLQYHRQLDRRVLYFFVYSAVLLGLTSLGFYVWTGRADWPYWSEVHFQGLDGPRAAAEHPMTEYVFWQYPRLLFQPNTYGNWVFSVLPHAAVVLGLLGWLVGARSSLVVFWWFLFSFLGMQFNIQRADGAWVAGFRNVRHLHPIVYPLVLLVTGYLVTLRARFPRIGTSLAAALVAFGAWQSFSTAEKTIAPFEDRRRACHFLYDLPPKTVYADFQIDTWCSILAMYPPTWTFRTLHGFDRNVRQKELAAIGSGYLVTGGGREPYYGCIDCIVHASEIDPQQWRLLMEHVGPTEVTTWRAEPLRIWERVTAAP